MLQLLRNERHTLFFSEISLLLSFITPQGQHKTFTHTDKYAYTDKHAEKQS